MIARLLTPKRLLLSVVLAILTATALAGEGDQGEGPESLSDFRLATQGDVALVHGAPTTLRVTRIGRDGRPDLAFDWAAEVVGVRGISDLEGAPIPDLEPRAPREDGRRSTVLRVEDGVLVIENAVVDDAVRFDVRGEGHRELAAAPLPDFVAVLPPIVAIGLAIAFRQVLLALFAGIWAGGWAIAGGAWDGFRYTVTDLLPATLADADRLSIIVFSSLLGSVVALVARMGGTRALVDAMSRIGESRRGAQLTTWVSGILIFFDDYANALLVGNTMRPITDRFRVSREKLAYLVDSTSAPVACIFIVSTWIAAEVGYIQGKLQLESVQLATGFSGTAAYEVFIATIPYNFYPIFCLVFGLGIVVSGRDFGPMRRAELRAAREGKLLSDTAVPLSSREMDDLEPVDPERLRWWNAVLPIGTVVIAVLGGLWTTGSSELAGQAETLRREAVGLRVELDTAADDAELRSLVARFGDPELDLETEGDLREAIVRRIGALEASAGALESPSLRDVFGNSNSYHALLVAAFLGVAVALACALGQRLMGLGEALDVTTAGIKAMMPAILVLALAWALQATCERLNTSEWLVQHVGFTVSLLPTVIFLLAAVIGFSTGTSWGTMGILVPLTIDYAVGLGAAESLATAETARLMVTAIGGVLAGAVFGDHCSPISDTTIMSSMASGSDHVDHVRTQMPYALVVAGVAVLFGYLPAGLGLPGLLGVSDLVLLPLGAAACIGLILLLGRRLPEDGASDS